MFAPKAIPSGVAAGEVGRGRPAARHHVVGGRGGREAAAEVGVRLAQAGVDRVEHLLGHLRAAGPVEVGGAARERREARPHGGHVKRLRAAP